MLLPFRNSHVKLLETAARRGGKGQSFVMKGTAAEGLDEKRWRYMQKDYTEAADGGFAKNSGRMRADERASSPPRIRIHRHEWEAAELVHNGSFLKLRSFIIPYLTDRSMQPDEEPEEALQDKLSEFLPEDDAYQMSRLLSDGIPETWWNGMRVRYVIDWSRNVRFKGYHKWIPVNRDILKKMKINEVQLHETAVQNNTQEDYLTYSSRKSVGISEMLILDPIPPPKNSSGENTVIRKLSWCSLLLKDSSWEKLENLAKSSFYLLPLFRARFYLFPLTENEDINKTILEMIREAAAAAPDGIDLLTDKIFYFSDGKLKEIL